MFWKIVGQTGHALLERNGGRCHKDNANPAGRYSRTIRPSNEGKITNKSHTNIWNDFWRKCWFSIQFNDIAILTLESPVEFTDRISTVCLPRECHEGAQSGYARTLGWGNTKEGERNSNVLLHTTTEFISKKTCIERTTSRQIELADHMICALHSNSLCKVCKYFGDNLNKLLFFF